MAKSHLATMQLKYVSIACTDFGKPRAVDAASAGVTRSACIRSHVVLKTKFKLMFSTLICRRVQTAILTQLATINVCVLRQNLTLTVLTLIIHQNQMWSMNLLPSKHWLDTFYVN
jgi:hypothetical protein